jgi:hypothetical protein
MNILRKQVSNQTVLNLLTIWALLMVFFLFAEVAHGGWVATKIEIADSKDKTHVSGMLRSKISQRLTIRATINGEHAVLECSTDKCEEIAPGIYDGEIHKNEVHIMRTTPLTHKRIRETWRLIGAW